VRLVWAIIPLVIFSIVGISESFAESEEQYCNDGLILIKKISSPTLACVKPNTAEKLVERGWAIKLSGTSPVQLETDKNVYRKGEVIRVTITNLINESYVYDVRLFDPKGKQFFDCLLRTAEIPSINPNGTTVDGWELSKHCRDEPTLPGRYMILFYSEFGIAILSIMVEEDQNEFDERLGQTSGVKPIPKGSFESAIQISPEDVDEFANKIATYVDDKIKNRVEITTGLKYVTERGSIKMVRDNINFTSFEYNGYTKGNPSFAEGEKITKDLIKDFGIVLDGTEFEQFYTTSYGANLFKYIQMKDGVLVTSNQIKLTFEPVLTYIKITNWNDNLSEMNLLDSETAQKIGMDYARTFEYFVESHCDIKMEDYTKLFPPYEAPSLKIISGTPVYFVYSGTCQVSSALISQDFFTNVNALTGEPYSIERGFSI